MLILAAGGSSPYLSSVQHTVYLCLFVCKLHFSFIRAELTRAGAKNKNKIVEVPQKMQDYLQLHQNSKRNIYMHCVKNIARIANAVQVTICLLVSTSVY